MPIKSEVSIQTLQKSQDRHNISFSFEFNNINIKKVFGANLPLPDTSQLDLLPDVIRVNLWAFVVYPNGFMSGGQISGQLNPDPTGGGGSILPPNFLMALSSFFVFLLIPENLQGCSSTTTPPRSGANKVNFTILNPEVKDEIVPKKHPVELGYPAHP